MFKLVAFLALLAVASAQLRSGAYGRTSAYGQVSTPTYAKSTYTADHDAVHAEVKADTRDVRADGFNYVVQTSNGIRTVASGDDYGRMQGEFGWIEPSGQHVDFTFIADENGYQPSSEWIPTPPPIPVAILKSLEYIRAHSARN